MASADESQEISSSRALAGLGRLKITPRRETNGRRYHRGYSGFKASACFHADRVEGEAYVSGVEECNLGSMDLIVHLRDGIIAVIRVGCKRTADCRQSTIRCSKKLFTV